MPAGRPRIIPSPERMESLVEEYKARQKQLQEPLTLTGMIIHLGLSSRESFDEYGRREEFSDSVRKAKLLIENEYEKKLQSTTPTGSIFALKNFGWKDRQDVAHQDPDGNALSFNVTLIASKDNHE